MEPVYVYFGRHQPHPGGGEIITHEAVSGMVNIDYDKESNEAVGVEILTPTDVQFDGVSIRDIRHESLTRRKSLQFTQQVSGRRQSTIQRLQRSLAAAENELAQWRSSFGESALYSHLQEVSWLRARARAAVVLPPDAALNLHSFLSGWLSAQDGEVITEDQLHDLATALVESLEEENVVAERDRAEATPDTTKVWRIVTDVPAHITDEQRDSFFTTMADAVHGWEPENRKGWDIGMSASLVDPTNRVPSVDDVEHAIAVLAAVPHCAYEGPVTGARCSVPVGRLGALCEDHTAAMVANTEAMREMAQPEADRTGDDRS